MNQDQTLIRLEHVSKEYETAEGVEPLKVLSDVSLSLGRGETAAFTGPSGSGKSTLLNLIGTLDQPSSGKVLFDGNDLAGYNEKELAKFRNEKIGFVFQAHHLLPQCTVLENVLVPTLVNGKSSQAADRAKTLLDKVGLGSRASHRPGQLSGGERQRAAFVRALINQPSVLLADEPTGALDHNNATHLMDLLIELNQSENVTLIVVTHALDLAKRMNKVFELKEGRLVES